ncbi:MAG: phospho-N-acetylmuramoyl-pentapeptide-transferase [Chlamydiota bacterium]|nr:phospho-N-acetylmuramoyl-pentapeptide-transferase [Chlamydiota bacterium]
MIILLEFLQSLGFKVPGVFLYYSTRMMLAALTALLMCIFLGPKFIKKLYELKIGQNIRTDECPLLGELHRNKKDTPTMGGLLIITSMLLSMFLWMDLKHPFTMLLLVTTIVLGFIGGMDDYLKLKYKNTKGLSGKKKLLGQVLLSVFVALYLLVPSVTEAFHVGDWFAEPAIKIENYSRGATGTDISLKDYASRVYLPFFKGSVFTFSGVFTLVAALLIIFVITGSSNSVNLTDGLDGLAAGTLLMVSVCFAVIAFVSNNLDIARYLNITYVEGSGEVAIYLSAFAGACLGFLWYNSHPAQVFMGDTGSLTLGGVLGVSVVLLKRELLFGVVGGIFVAEAMSVILQVASYKLRNKKRVFLCAPLHHHFEYKGWPETKVVIRFWIIGFLLAVIGLASLKFQ